MVRCDLEQHSKTRLAKVIFVSLFALHVPVVLGAGMSISNGESFSVENDNVLIDGDMALSPGSYLDAGEGTIALTGNWLNDGVFVPGLSDIVFNGLGAQSVTRTNAQDTAVVFNQLTLNNPQGLRLFQSISVVENLIFQEGSITLGNYDLLIQESANIVNASADNYIITNGSGVLVQKAEVGSEIFYPIGFSENAYTPIKLVATSGSDNIGVTANNTITHSILDPSAAVGIEWGFIESDPGSSRFNVTVFWPEMLQGSDFNPEATMHLGVWDDSSYKLFLSEAVSSQGMLLGSLFSGVSSPTQLVIGNSSSIRLSPPILEAIANQVTNEDFGFLSIPLVATDLDADTIDFFAEVENNQLVSINVEGDQLTLNSYEDSYGDAIITVTARSAGESDSQSFTLEVYPVNDPPVVQRIDDLYTNEKQVFSFSIDEGLITDVDSDLLMFNATLQDGSALPDWLSFSPMDSNFWGTPPWGSAGLLPLRYVASDGDESTSQDFILHISPDLPVDPSVDFRVINEVYQRLTFDEIRSGNSLPSDVKGDLNLVSTLGFGDVISWKSSNEATVSEEGNIFPANQSLYVHLYASITVDDKTLVKPFLINVTGTELTAQERLQITIDGFSFDAFALTNTHPDRIYTDLDLVSSVNGYSVGWESDNDAIVNVNTGEVYPTSQNNRVRLSATFTDGTQALTKSFDLEIVKAGGAEEAAAEVFEWLSANVILNGNRHSREVLRDLYLPEVGHNGVAIDWVTSDAYLGAQRVSAVEMDGKVERHNTDVCELVSASIGELGAGYNKNMLVNVSASSELQFGHILREDLLTTERLETSSDSLNTRVDVSYLSLLGVESLNSLLLDQALIRQVVQSSTGFDVASYLASTARQKTEIHSYLNANGSLENIVRLNVDGIERNLRIASASTGTTSQIFQKGEVELSVEKEGRTIMLNTDAESNVSYAIDNENFSTQGTLGSNNAEVEVDTVGNVEASSCFLDNNNELAQLSVYAFLDGGSGYKLNVLPGETQVVSELIGARTTFDDVEGINSYVPIPGAVDSEAQWYAYALTDIEGRGKFGFSKMDNHTGEIVESKNLLASESAFDAGHVATIKYFEDAVGVEIITPITGLIKF